MAHSMDHNTQTSGSAAIGRSAPADAGGFLQHIYDAVSRWSRNADDDEMGAYLEKSGGRLTDNIEREMMRVRTVSNWRNHG